MSLKFWKKDDLALPDFDKQLGLDQSSPDLTQHFDAGANQAGFNPLPPFPPAPSFQQPGFQQSSFQTPSSFPSQPALASQQNSSLEWEAPAGKDHLAKDLEIIAAKLDTIRAQLDMLNARVANIEQQGRNEHGARKPWY